MRNTVIFDLDNTLSNLDHRLPLIKRQQGEQLDWTQFNLQSQFDTPIQPMIDTLNAYYEAGWDIEIWTGRSIEVQQITEKWLINQGIDPLLLINMRERGDHRPGWKLKNEWLDDFIKKHGYKPHLAIDDDPAIVTMFLAKDVYCIQPPRNTVNQEY